MSRRAEDSSHSRDTALLLDLLDHAFERRAWHGTTLAGSLRGLDAATAAWRPAPARHNIWELTVHCAYWKYAICRRLSKEDTPEFGLAGSNWFERPADEMSGKAWKADVRRLKDWHARLREKVAAFDPGRLDARAGNPWTFRDLITGIAAHDLYHVGQIQLLKRLQ